MTDPERLPFKIGVRFKPPAIILFYHENSKLKKRIMPVRGLKTNSSARTFATDFMDHHLQYIKNVPSMKIEKMVRLIQNDMRGKDLQDGLEELEHEYSVDPEEDLNALDDVNLSRKKQLMDLAFEMGSKKPGDPEFEYDVEVDFLKEGGSIESSAWDSDKEDLEF